jgi:hypothetical protein
MTSGTSGYGRRMTMLRPTRRSGRWSTVDRLDPVVLVRPATSDGTEALWIR